MTEHFVTLFDKNFMLFGLALHKSLLKHAGDFCLWVICMDDATESKLNELRLPKLRVINLATIENESLLMAKSNRTAGEYCWTMTPFSITAVFDADENVNRVTYLDADVYFFADPRILIDEMVDHKKHALITEHAYDPRYDQTKASGRFCVQFMTFNRSEKGLRVCKWWQDRCLEWCYNRVEDDKFGDQKYLDSWPEMFANEVHILNAVDQTLAPWNAKLLLKPYQNPVMYHFHGFRFLNKNRARLFDGYDLGREPLRLYNDYILTLRSLLSELSLNLAIEPPPETPREYLARIWRRLNGTRTEHTI